MSKKYNTRKPHSQKKTEVRLIHTHIYSFFNSFYYYTSYFCNFPNNVCTPINNNKFTESYMILFIFFIRHL